MIMSCTNRILSLFPLGKGRIISPFATIQHQSSSLYHSSSLVKLPSYSLSCSWLSSSSMSKLLSHSHSQFLPLRFASSFSDLDGYTEKDYSKCRRYFKKRKLRDLEEDAEKYLKELKDSMVREEVPFEIIEIPGKVAINLKREFAGERVDCVLDWDFRDSYRYHKKSFRVYVTIDKGYGPRYQFFGTLDYEKSKIVIDRLLIKGREESSDAYQMDLDKNLIKGFRAYLRTRGIVRGWDSIFRMYMWAKVDVYLKNMIEKLDSNSFLDNAEEVKKELCMYFYSLED